MTAYYNEFDKGAAAWLCDLETATQFIGAYMDAELLA